MKILKSRNGSTIIIFLAAFSALVAAAALTIDIGMISFEKSRLSATLDAAALAGAQELVMPDGNASDVAFAYIAKNSSGLKDIVVIQDHTQKTIEVSGSRTVNNMLASFFGNDSEDISAIVKACVENIKSLSGARPLAVVQQVFNYGQIYILKEGGGGGTTGNYAAIALGGGGASVYRDNMLYGYSGTLTVGDIIETETGNIAGTTVTTVNTLINGCSHYPQCTYNSYINNCPRIIFIPIVDTLTVNGKKCIKVLGFGTFFLESITSHAGQADVIGRFITYYMEGQTANDIGDFGTYGIRLVRN